MVVLLLRLCLVVSYIQSAYSIRASDDSEEVDFSRARPVARPARPAARFPVARPVTQPRPATTLPVAHARPVTNSGFSNLQPSAPSANQPHHPVAKPVSQPQVPSAPPFGGSSSRPNFPVARPVQPNFPVAKPANQPQVPSAPPFAGGSSQPRFPVARPVQPSIAAPTPNIASAMGRHHSQTPAMSQPHGRPLAHANPAYQPPHSQGGYSKAGMLGSFGGGMLAGAGGMYLFDRLTQKHTNSFSSNRFGPRLDSGTLHVHHHYDGPYYDRQWRHVSNEEYKQLPPPRDLQIKRATSPTNLSELSTEGVLCIDTIGHQVVMSLHYRERGQSRLQTLSTAAIDTLVAGSKSFGLIEDQMRSGSFRELKEALDFYVPKLEQKVKLIGIALNVKIGVIPSYKWNVTAAQDALDHFEWNQTKARYVVARVISAAWQAQLELETQWVNGYTGFMSTDEVSGTRLAAAGVGSQSFEMSKHETVKRWKGHADMSDLTALIYESEFARIKSSLVLPSAGASSFMDMGSIDAGSDSTSAEKVSGYWIAAGGFCDGASAAGIVCCEKDETGCQLHTTNAAIEKLTTAFNRIKLSSETRIPEIEKSFDIVYTLAALEQWLNAEARVMFAKPVDATLSRGAAIQLFKLKDTESNPIHPIPDSSAIGKPGHATRTDKTKRQYKDEVAVKRLIKASFMALSIIGLCFCCCLCVCCGRSFSGSKDTSSASASTPAYASTYAHPTVGAQPAGSATSQPVSGVPIQAQPIAGVQAVPAQAQPVLGVQAVPVQAQPIVGAQAMTPQPVGVQAVPATAMTPELEQGYLDFQCPPGAGPGSVVEVKLPNGLPHQVEVPDGIYPGMMFSVAV
eukprot:TRINITY_DN23453_c0_g1_i1.p1 TRINITY_DN23453_c0_g1~~TRINITY_DN23453_c0_g1_i1.p1  ORF type:complete len:850 (+),score=76.25 TRINITY_DN23453_c0_g1_i1:43-2592(+)